MDILTILPVLRVILFSSGFYIDKMPDFYGNLETSILCVIVILLLKIMLMM